MSDNMLTVRDLAGVETADSVPRHPESTTPVFMSQDATTRKKMPVASGVLAYFPDALRCIAWVSRVGNDQHNPGQPLHWAKEKSQDEPDAEVRHLLDHFTRAPVDEALRDLGEVAHLSQHAWRALAHLQRACDAIRAREDGRPAKTFGPATRSYHPRDVELEAVARAFGAGEGY